MFFSVEPANGLPIYDQIVRQIKFAVANRVLTSGDMVPSVREAARELAINPNTVVRAYRELQSAGILATIRGTGLQVTDEAYKRCRKDKSDLIRARLGNVLEEAKRAGLSANEIQAMVADEVRQLFREPHA